MTKSKVLHNLYRPQEWGDVVGHDTIIKSLRDTLKRKGSQCFLFSSAIPGVGKTTLALLTAYEFGCTQDTIMDINGATYTGIDAMRAIKETADYAPLGKSNKRGIIIDEAHRLSGQAWDSLLKATENPPEHLIWIFCTTNVKKIPATLKSRATKYELKPVDEKTLGKLYDEVCEAQRIQLTDEIADLIIRSAQGSPRQMLVNLETCIPANSKKEAATLLETALDTDATIELAKLLADFRPPSWPKVMSVVDKFDKGENWEGVRMVLINYMGACLKNAQNDKSATHFLTRIEAFAQPYNPSEGIAPLLRSIGQVLFG